MLWIHIGTQERLQANLCIQRGFGLDRVTVDVVCGSIQNRDAVTMAMSRGVLSRTMWSRVIESANRSGLNVFSTSTGLCFLLMHLARVVVALRQISQFGSRGKWVNILCFPLSFMRLGLANFFAFGEGGGRFISDGDGGGS